MKNFALLPALLLGLAFHPPRPDARPASDDGALAPVAFLAGHWRSEEQGDVTEEAWLAPLGGMMLGVNRSVPGSGRASFEFLRIEARADGVTYLASPGGSKPTPFRLEASADGEAVFENPDHDFPQRIRYALDDDGRLHAKIEGQIDGQTQSMEWVWKRVEGR